MNLKKSVKLMQKLLPDPDDLKEIQLAPSDYDKIQPKIKMKYSVFGDSQYESFAGYPVKCVPELKESLFVIKSHTYTSNPGYVYGRVSREVYMLADLSYMMESI